MSMRIWHAMLICFSKYGERYKQLFIVNKALKPGGLKERFYKPYATPTP
jgi:hypothetical protein